MSRTLGTDLPQGAPPCSRSIRLLRSCYGARAEVWFRDSVDNTELLDISFAMLQFNNGSKPIQVLAICSSGGHWVQMRRIAPAFRGANVIYASPFKDYPEDLHGEHVTIPDANRWNKLKLIWMSLNVALLVIRKRPSHIVSTGAAPGYIAIRVGKWIGAKTMWLDSIANAEKLSLSGQKAGKHADRWLTQWPHLAEEDGPEYSGSVL